MADDARRDFAEELLLILHDAGTGNVGSLGERMERLAPTPKDVWAVCCAIASMVATCVPNKDADGTFRCTVEVTDEAAAAQTPPIVREAVERVAAFLAAVANDDYAGAHLVFVDAGETEDTAGAFVSQLLAIGAATVRDLTEGQPGG